MNNLSNNLIEYIGLTSRIEDDYDVYKNHFIEKNINLNNETTPISEITQVFMECAVIDYAIVPAFNSVSVDGERLSDNICFVQCELNLSIQYIEDNNSCQLSVINGKEFFSTFIMLPDNFIAESDLIVKCYLDYAKVTALNPTKIFLHINSIVTVGIY